MAFTTTNRLAAEIPCAILTAPVSPSSWVESGVSFSTLVAPTSRNVPKPEAPAVALVGPELCSSEPRLDVHSLNGLHPSHGHVVGCLAFASMRSPVPYLCTAFCGTVIDCVTYVGLCSCCGVFYHVGYYVTKRRVALWMSQHGPEAFHNLNIRQGEDPNGDARVMFSV